MRKVTLVNQYELPVTIQPDGEGFLARCSSWSDCYAAGDTIDEALSEIVAVAGSLIELYNEEDLKVPLKVKKRTNLSDKLIFEVPVVVTS